MLLQAKGVDCMLLSVLNSNRSSSAAVDLCWPPWCLAAMLPRHLYPRTELEDHQQAGKS